MTREEDAMGLARSRRAITSVFLLNGLALSSFIVRLPSLKAQHHLNNGQIGVVGMLFGLSALASMQFVGSLVGRFGSGPILRIALPALAVALVGVGVSGGVLAYTIAVMALGAVHGTTDAAMNAHAVTVERLAGRPILSGCHAAWSISAVIASLAGAIAVHAGLSTTAHFLIIGGFVVAGDLLAGPFLLAAAVDRRAPTASTASGRPTTGWRAGWTKLVIRIGLTGTVLMVCEGAALGWGAIYLHETRGASVAVASIAVTAFAGGQTAGRVIGDRLTLRFGASTLFRACGLIGVVGLTVAVLSPRPAVAIAGFAILGLGSSVLIPLTFSAVGHAGGSGPGAAAFVSRFTTFTYAGILIGPAVIGGVSQLVGLTTTLAALIPMLAFVALASRLPGTPRHPESEPDVEAVEELNVV
jgi:MFS family permease